MAELPRGVVFNITNIEKSFNFSFADNAVDLMRGLAGAKNLGEYDGMLFDFGCAFSPIMTPVGLLFPVEVAFVTVAGEIVEIHTLDPDYGFTQGTLRKDIQYALEVPVGFFDTYDIIIGDFITIGR